MPWKDVVGYEGLYRVSSKGKVRSLDRTVIDARGHKRTFLGQPMKLVEDKDGYLLVSLCKNGKSKLSKVHRLVLEAFVGPCPPGLICRHEDDNPKNNNVSNLSWATHKTNQADRAAAGRGPQGERNGNAKLTEQDIEAIRRLRKEGWKIRGLADRFGVCERTIGCIINHLSWRT